MSYNHNQKVWIATKEDLKNALLCEKVLRSMKPINDRKTAHKFCGELYARFIILCNNLGELYDQTLHSQKRDVIEKIMITATKRLLELKSEMQKIEMSEYICIDDELIELKLTPQNIEFLCPFYFPRKRDVASQRIVDEIPKSPTQSEIQLLNDVKGIEKLKLEAQQNPISNRKKSIENIDGEKSDEIETDYQFFHKPDQIPLRKLKRTEFHFKLFRSKKVTEKRYKFYEPPKFAENEFGQIVRIKEKVASFYGDNSEGNDDDDIDPELERAQKIQAEIDEKHRQKVALEDLREKSAMKIQKAYRVYKWRKLVKLRQRKKLEICGLIPKLDDSKVQIQKSLAELDRQKRHERKREFDEKVAKLLKDEKTRILNVRGKFIMEDITDHIREWFKEFYKGAKDFDRYPEEFENGTILVLTGESKTVEEFLIEKNKTPEQKKKEKVEKKKLKKKEKKERMKMKEKEKKLDLDRINLEKKQGPTWVFSDEKKFNPTNYVDLGRLLNDYQHEWRLVTEDRHESPIHEWITIDAYADVHKELRLIVDDFMRIELELLRMALARDNHQKFKPSKRKKPKKEKKKKKKKNQRESIDFISEFGGLDNCYQELKSMNIIRKYSRRSLEDFIGDLNFGASDLRALNKPTTPCYGDIKNILRFLILGMGPISEFPKFKSFCIVGPEKCGKKLLVEALCTEMDAVMFDLSAKVVKQIENLETTLAMVMQVAKRLQPSVIFVDGAHKPFIRSIQPEEMAEEPRKLGRHLFAKIVKKLTAEDAVMLIGTTNQPWNSQLDYGTSLMVWNEGLRRSGIENFDVSALARVTRNYTTGNILEFLDNHLHPMRVKRISIEPLKIEEILEDLLTGVNQISPMDVKIVDKFTSFANRTDLFYSKRNVEMARVQVIIDKQKELERKKKEAAAKKKK